MIRLPSLVKTHVNITITRTLNHVRGSLKSIQNLNILSIFKFIFRKMYNTCIQYNSPYYMCLSLFVCLFICLFILFVCGLSSHSRIFHSYGDVTIADEGLQILTCARHSRPWSSEGSLTCHTYGDTGLPFIMVISEDPWHSHLLASVWQWSSHYLFLRLRSVTTGD